MFGGFCLEIFFFQSFVLIHMYELMLFICCSYIRTYMDKPTWTKTKGFRLPQRTLDQLDFLVENGAGRNATEVVIIAIERLTTQYETPTLFLPQSMMLQVIMGKIEENNGTDTFIEEAVANLPDNLVLDRDGMLNMLKYFWDKKEIEKIKELSDEDMKKVIAARMYLSTDYLKSQLGRKCYY